jgi:hypothetical protein
MKKENKDPYHCAFDKTTWADTIKKLAIVVV